MENTYIIFDEGFQKQAEYIETNLSIGKISYQAHENERGFHDWLTREFKNKDIRRILIPLSLPTSEENTEGLLLGLHIRLNYELPIEKRSIPIVFISNLSFENILTKSNFDSDNNPQNMLFAEGTYVSSSDIDEIKEKLGIAKPVDDYNLFLRQQNIRRKAIVGGHDIANAWGCYKLAQVAENKDDIGKPNRIKDDIFRQEFIAKHLKQLYAKYLICNNESFNDELRLQKNPIKCQGKQILFIDDKADEGWGILMQYVFKIAGAGFTCVDPSPYKNKEKTAITDFDGFISECKSHIGKRWDLIIIDLRLNPETEDIDKGNLSPEDFSGYKLIDDFLNENGGYQILVSTASNKIWNIDAALKRGAKGYYIKESPDFNYQLDETEKQFKSFRKEVEICFENAYLQDIFSSMETIKEKLKTSAFEESIKKQLDLAFYLISKAETQEQYAFAYVSLYLVIEMVNKQFFKNDQEELTNYSVEQEQIYLGKTKQLKHKYWNVVKEQMVTTDTCVRDFPKILLNYCIRDGKNVCIDEHGAHKATTIKTKDSSEFVKIANFLKNNGADDNSVISISQRIQARNWFIHNDSKLQQQYKDKNGVHYSFPMHREIYSKEGFQELFSLIELICSYLCH